MVSQAMDSPSTENTSGFVLLWSRDRENRYYSMINCETGVFYIQEQKCPGHRVLCMTRVGNRTWMGTEVRQKALGESLFTIICLIEWNKRFSL